MRLDDIIGSTFLQKVLCHTILSSFVYTEGDKYMLKTEIYNLYQLHITQ